MDQESAALGLLHTARRFVELRHTWVAHVEAVLGWSLYAYWIHPGEGRRRRTFPRAVGWTLRFHGLECDLAHDDGRFMRVDFGPNDHPGTFSYYGLSLFLESSWRDHDPLRDWLRKHEYESGAIHRLGDLHYARGWVEPSDVELDRRNQEGVPDDRPHDDPMARMLAGRPSLSAKGLAVLEASGLYDLPSRPLTGA
ncbi:MAG: hypothetical protein AAGA48_17540 [Myxococcota bacterium]